MVRPGETLFALARRYDTSVTAIKELNGLSSDLLRVGMELTLPGGASWREIIAPEGAGWSDVATSTGRSEATLRDANPEVADPGGEVVRVPPADGPLVWAGEGDDLLSLAARAGVAPSALGEANGLTPPYRVRPGQPLVVPSEGTSSFAPTPQAVAGRGGAASPPASPSAPQVALPPRHERRPAHAALRQRALNELGTVLQGRVLTPPDEGFVWPLEGAPRLTSRFGWRNVSVAGNRYHQGIDLGAAHGAVVRAANGGVVTRAGWTGAYGYAVYLRHDDGYETRYAHLSRIGVGLGQRVDRGEAIGAVGSTGASTGPHLHFEARLDGRALDPLDVLPGVAGRAAR